MRGGNVPVAIAERIVEVDIESPGIRAIVGVTTDKGEAIAPQVPVFLQLRYFIEGKLSFPLGYASPLLQGIQESEAATFQERALNALARLTEKAPAFAPVEELPPTRAKPVPL